MLRHELAHFLPDGHGVFGAVLGEERLIFFVLAFLFTIEDGGGNGVSSLLEIFGVFHRGGAGDAATEDATDERVGAESIGAVVLVFAFAGGVNAGDVGGLIHGVHPDAAPGVVHAGENFHGLFAGINAADFFIDFRNALQ